MSNPILIANSALMVTDAGRGTTPECSSRFKRGDVVRVRNMEAVRHMPRRAIVAAVVPPNFSPDWALADLLGEPRPLMATKPYYGVSYILVNQGDKTPYLVKEKYLMPSGWPPVEIGSVARETEAGQ